jgi:hypothetical protein
MNVSKFSHEKGIYMDGLNILKGKKYLSNDKNGTIAMGDKTNQLV